MKEVKIVAYYCKRQKERPFWHEIQIPLLYHILCHCNKQPSAGFKSVRKKNYPKRWNIARKEVLIQIWNLMGYNTTCKREEMKKDEEHHKRKEKKQKDMYEGKGKTNHTDRHKNNTKQGNK